MILTIGAIGSDCLNAQTISDSKWYDFDFIRQSDIRLTAENPALLSTLPNIRISTAQISFVKNNGELINYYQSPDSYTMDVQTASFFRVHDQLVLYGLVNYQQFNGKKMGGSAFINPNIMPFNIVEATDTTRGTKQKESYHIVGGIAYNVAKKITIGAQLDYMAVNYVKRKDLRHKNKMLDLTTTAGINYKINRKTELGGNIFLQKRVEGVYFNIYGTSDKRHVSLIDYGTFFGRTETFTELGDGYTSGKQERPLVSNVYGGAVQLQLNLSQKIKIFNHFYIRNETGYYGEKSSYSIVHTEYKAYMAGYQSGIQLHSHKNTHRFDINIDTKTLNNFKNIYTIENAPGEMSYVKYHDKNKMLHHSQQKIALEYLGNIGISGYHARWMLNGSVTLTHRDRQTSLYPFFRKQNLTYWDSYLSVRKNFFRQTDCIGLSFAINYGAGNGNPYTDGTYTNPSDTEIPPKTTPSNLYTEHDYFISPHYGIEPNFLYSMKLKNNKIATVSLKYNYTKSFETVSKVNSYRQQLMFSFRYDF